jgi:FkbM family methyltransferase
MAAVKKAVQRLGFDIVRYRGSGPTALCGLGNLDCRTIIDVGANQGQFAKEARRLFPKARIHCFEPVPSALEVLVPWAEQDGGVEVHRVALGPEAGTTQFHIFEEYTPASSVLSSAHTPVATTQAAQTIDVPVETLDQVFQPIEALCEGPVLLKLDVQGYEGHVLRGGLNVLNAVDACVLEVCNAPLYEGQSTFAEIHALTQAAGLRFVGTSYQGFEPDGRVSYFDAVFRRET